MKPRYPTKPEAEITKLTEFTGRMARETTALLNNGLTIADNLAAAIIEVDLVHNADTLIANPLRNGSIPSGIVAMDVVENVPTDLSTFVPSLIPSLAWYPGPDGLLRVRAQYPVPNNYVVVQATGAQSIAHNTLTVVTYAATPTVSVGTGITYNGTSTLTASQAGIYDVSAGVHITAAAGGTRFSAILNAAGNRTVGLEIPGQAGGDFYGALIKQNEVIAAADTRRLQVYQNQTAVAALNTSNNAYPFLSMRQVDHTSGYSRRVRLYVYAG